MEVYDNLEHCRSDHWFSVIKTAMVESPEGMWGGFIFLMYFGDSTWIFYNNETQVQKMNNSDNIEDHI